MRTLHKISILFAGTLVLAGAASGQEPLRNRVLTHHEQAPIVHGWIEK